MQCSETLRAQRAQTIKCTLSSLLPLTQRHRYRLNLGSWNWKIRCQQRVWGKAAHPPANQQLKFPPNGENASGQTSPVTRIRIPPFTTSLKASVTPTWLERKLIEMMGIKKAFLIPLILQVQLFASTCDDSQLQRLKYPQFIVCETKTRSTVTPCHQLYLQTSQKLFPGVNVQPKSVIESTVLCDIIVTSLKE